MATNINIQGFSLLRNGIKYDYPFIESLSSLQGLCEDVFLALGDSEDDTEEKLKELAPLEVIPTKWDPALMGDGGQILSQQTNIALEAARGSRSSENSWGFYLQTDELIHEADIQRIKEDIAEAEASGCDAVRFRYYHFWLNHNQVAISKRWYPQEVRAIRLDSNIRSHGDAQGFSGIGKVFESDVTIYHYGHVREEEKRQAKQELLMKMIRPGDKLSKYMKRESRDFNQTETLPFYGPHPKWMRERIERFGDHFSLEAKDVLKIYDPNSLLTPKAKAHIKAKKIENVSERSESDISFEPSFWQKIGLKRKFPCSMKSPLARHWGPEEKLYFQLWSQGIATTK